MAGAWRRRLQASRLVALAVLCLGVGSPAAATPAPVALRPFVQAQLFSGPPRSRDREPDVRLVEPPPQHAPIDAVVRLQFSRRMAMGSVLRSFRIDPAIDGVLEWPDDRTLVFRPLLPLAYQGTYPSALPASRAAARRWRWARSRSPRCGGRRCSPSRSR